MSAAFDGAVKPVNVSATKAATAGSAMPIESLRDIPAGAACFPALRLGILPLSLNSMLSFLLLKNC
jgi:hypothetical protein